MNDNNKPDQPVNELLFFHFAYKFENDGVCQSRLGEVETRDKLNRELATLYGPDGITLTELRPATDEEVEAYKTSLEKQTGLTPEDIDRMTQEPVEEPTIN